MAVSVKVPAELGAVYIPDAETVPPLAVQLTAVLLVFFTDAVNCCCAFTCNVALCGLTVTDTEPGVGAGMFALAPPAQPTIVTICSESRINRESRQMP